MEVMEERSDTQINENVKSIKPIHEETVHKICSGQVVLSLAIAVKELVENSLDAGATVIDVRLKNYGTDSIEVSDNGFGVAEENFAALTLKYHTSKLNDYSDLLGVKSFGFRGEALSSLCALANLTVITRHKNTEYATKIEYDHKSNITKKTLCSRQLGTTVILSNLFHSLPVRQKELQKNARREFNKMTQLLYAYCLISKGVRISCTNQNSNNAKSTVVATQGSSSYEDNIVCVFGHKQLNNILEIKPEYVTNIKGNIFRGLSGEVEQAQDSVSIEDVEIDLSEDSNDANSAEKPGSQSNQSVTNSQKSQGYKNCVFPVEFTGYISSCTHGCGRSSTDRQFIYINSRPCEPTKIIKLINDVYRQYNPNQYPFVFLNISLERDGVDVNVTPDKRKIFLTKEKIILETLKASLLKLFENIPRTLKVDTTLNVYSKNIDDDVKPEVNQPRIFSSFIQRFANKNVDNTDIAKKNELKRKSTTILDFVSTKTVKVDPDYPLETENSIDEENETTIDNNNSDKDNVTLNDDIKENIIKEIEETNHKHTDILYLENTDCIPDTQIRNLSDVIEKKPHKTKCEHTLSIEGDNFKKKKTKIVITDKQNLGSHHRKSVTLKTSLDHVKALTSIYNEHKEKSIPERIKFRSSINPVFNKKCEEELSKEISKDSFKNMHIVGQFNLGFILTKLDEDLFIIDQHATDEIYNFETLQKTTELTKQVLVIPQQLELSGVNEQILIDSLDVFKKNGFTFDINEAALPTKRVKLLTIPMSRNWIFGKEDIEELLFMLKESPSEYCRPSRVRAMFASRACRKSVMIGTALAKSDMKTLVDHMAEIDKPWNCPHGRPTIRHLVNLAMVHTNEN